jgi:hypothetical protein
MIEHFGEVERAVAATGLSFGEAMRMLAGANITAEEDADDVEAFSTERTFGEPELGARTCEVATSAALNSAKRISPKPICGGQS